jgi:hypothetical protein
MSLEVDKNILLTPNLDDWMQDGYCLEIKEE